VNAGDAIRTLLVSRWRRNFCLPNFTPRRWWECDLFELTAAGYFREYEVKVSLADFRADAGKESTAWTPGQGRRVERKHDLLARGDPRGPSRFWYVVPAGLVDVAAVPAWAGLIEMHTAPSCAWYRERVVRPAPRLHREACPAAAAQHARGICCWRMHELRNRLAEKERATP
jgi:hypothetical protein